MVAGLRARAGATPQKPAFTFLSDGADPLELTYAELDARAPRPGRTAASGDHGQRSAGPAALPRGTRLHRRLPGLSLRRRRGRAGPPPGALAAHLPRLQAIADDARPSLVLTTTALARRMEGPAKSIPGLDAATWLDTTDLPNPPTWRQPRLRPDSPAFLQYTSGSTSTPKGVRVSHGNLMANEERIRRAFGQDEDSVIVGWLPLYHDMGLIGNVLQPLYVGARCVLISPTAFLQRPVRWLEAISQYRGTTSGGPNFAYDLCVRRISEQQRAELDLSSWKVAFSGAEPVRAETLDRFAEAFAPQGFEHRAFLPCYGLAEATLLVSGERSDEAPRRGKVASDALARHRVVAPGDDEAYRMLVSCGPVGEPDAVRIIDPETLRPSEDSQVGEIWVRGPSVAEGYWQRPEETVRDFEARPLKEDGTMEDGVPFLRTGDLGFVHDGQLYVTGRLKEMVIVRGRNLYPQDIEWTAERSHPALRPGHGAAFSVDSEEGEQLVVVHELERRGLDQAAEAADAVHRALAREHEVSVHEVVLVRPATIPKTSSGKIRRRACRTAYLAGQLGAVLSRRAETDQVLESGLQDLAALYPEERRDLLRDYLKRELARALRVAEAAVELERPLAELGLDSLAAAELMAGVEDDVGVVLSLEDLFDGGSIETLVARLVDSGQASEDGSGGAAGESQTLRALRVGCDSSSHHPTRPPTPGRPPSDAERVDARMARRGEILGEHPLSHGQRALWLLARMAPDSAAYNLATAARVRSGLDPLALERAWDALVRRHPLMRATLHEVRGVPRQRITATCEVSGFELIPGFATDADQALRAEAERPFDLQRGPLFRLLVAERPAGEYLLLLSVHHAVADFRSLEVITTELGHFYRGETGGAVAPLPPPGALYTDWVRDRERELAGEGGERLLSYWRRRLTDVPPVLELPTDRPRPATRSERGGRVFRVPWRGDHRRGPRAGRRLRSHGLHDPVGRLPGSLGTLQRSTPPGGRHPDLRARRRWARRRWARRLRSRGRRRLFRQPPGDDDRPR